ncbi:MAG: glycosyltransferase, partial [Bacteroidetes bacterium]|nr:glycosyltransferase [Bacteroidota bacterium]
MTNHPKISIITVTYNAEKLIERTINSVVGQSYSNIEYILVDGAST